MPVAGLNPTRCWVSVGQVPVGAGVLQLLVPGMAVEVNINSL